MNFSRHLKHLKNWQGDLKPLGIDTLEYFASRSCF